MHTFSISVNKDKTVFLPNSSFLLNNHHLKTDLQTSWMCDCGRDTSIDMFMHSEVCKKHIFQSTCY